MAHLNYERSRLDLYLQLVRFYKPIGSILIFVPGCFGMAIAAQGYPGHGAVAFMAAGAFCVRSIGCIMNDLTDATLDRTVARTRGRPLASGALTRLEAFYALAVLGAAALSLLIFAPTYVAYLTVVAVALIAAYPWMKRITFWPQAFLALAMNFSMLMGYAYITNTLTPMIYGYYLAFLPWTLFYDTVYAFQDLQDDQKTGIKSTARLLMENRIPIAPKTFLFCCQGLMSIGVALLHMYTCRSMLACFLVSLLLMGTALRFAALVDPRRNETCAHLFQRQYIIGFLLMLLSLT